MAWKSNTQPSRPRPYPNEVQAELFEKTFGCRSIRNHIVILVFTNSTIKASEQEPKDMTILRGEVLGQNGEEWLQGLLDPKAKKVKDFPVLASSG